MATCALCGQHLSNVKPIVITVVSDAELCHSDYVFNLRNAAADRRIPRRKWRDELARVLYRLDVEFVNPDGIPFDLPDIDDVFPKDKNELPELSDRGIGRFTTRCKPEETPTLQRRSYERARIFDAYFRLGFPGIAARFGLGRPANQNYPD